MDQCSWHPSWMAMICQNHRVVDRQLTQNGLKVIQTFKRKKKSNIEWQEKNHSKQIDKQFLISMKSHHFQLKIVVSNGFVTIAWMCVVFCWNIDKMLSIIIHVIYNTQIWLVLWHCIKTDDKNGISTRHIINLRCKVQQMNDQKKRGPKRKRKHFSYWNQIDDFVIITDNKFSHISASCAQLFNSTIQIIFVCIREKKTNAVKFPIIKYLTCHNNHNCRDMHRKSKISCKSIENQSVIFFSWQKKEGIFVI